MSTHLRIFASDCSQDSEWECDDCVNQQDDDNGAERQGCGGSVDDRHGVEEAEGNQQWAAKEGRGQQGVPHPAGPSQDLVRDCRNISRNSCCQGVQNLQRIIFRLWQSKNCESQAGII